MHIWLVGSKSSVKIKYQLHILKKRLLLGHSCFTNTFCIQFSLKATGAVLFSFNTIQKIPFKIIVNLYISEEKVRETGWPTKGEIQFKNVSLSYDPDQDPVVSDVSFTIKEGEKVH